MLCGAPTETGLDDMRTRCVDGVERACERAASTAWGLATSSSTRDEFVHAHVAPVRENSEAIEAYYKGIIALHCLI